MANRTANILGRVLRNLNKYGITNGDVEDEEIYDELTQGQHQIIADVNTDKQITITLKADVDSYPLTTNTVTDPALTTYQNNIASIKVIRQPDSFNYTFEVVSNKMFSDLIDGSRISWTGLASIAMGVNSADFIKTGENLLGAKNGVNKIFQFPEDIAENSDEVFLNGVRLTRDTHYTIVNSTITMISPVTGGVILIPADDTETLTGNYITDNLLGSAIVNTKQPLIGTILGGRLVVYPVPDSTYEDIEVNLFVYLKSAQGVIDADTEPELDQEYDKALEYFATAQFLNGKERQEWDYRYEKKVRDLRPLAHRKNHVYQRPGVF